MVAAAGTVAALLAELTTKVAEKHWPDETATALVVAGAMRLQLEQLVAMLDTAAD